MAQVIEMLPRGRYISLHIHMGEENIIAVISKMCNFYNMMVYNCTKLEFWISILTLTFIVQF